MPFIDVSELLTDPDFCEFGLICERTPRTMVNGRAVDGAPILETFAGAVTPDDGKTFARAPDATEVGDVVLIFTGYRLQAADVDAGIDADRVTTPDGAYLVKQVKSFARFGAGFVVAKCEKAPR